jgi:CHAD domain-containing protein
MQAMVQHCGIGPEVAETKPGFGIYGEEPVELAVRQMSLQMLRVAKGNQQGVVDDIDTEFLHQYRVSLRKSRSLINLMKKAFPADTHQRLKTLLGDLAGCTNQLRDLDVFLLGRESYAQMLPENFQAGFNQLFRMIAQDREKARKSVSKVFQSTDHANTFREVFEILEKEPFYENAFASQPVLEAASKKIIRRYQRIVALGLKIDDKTPDEEVHELRIECKKLRYMMEFFAELFPKKAIKVLIKTLKKLQTILGDFNDYSVQKEFLADYEKKHKRSVELSAAINGLIAVLHQKQLHERTRVQQAFADFNQDAVRETFSELFSSQNQPEAGK